MNSPEKAATLAQELLDGTLTTEQLARKIEKLVAEEDASPATAQPDEAGTAVAPPSSTTKLLVNAERAKRRIAAV
jgi:hypothetical protein